LELAPAGHRWVGIGCHQYFMRYTWTSVAILFIWISASVLMVSDRLTDPEIFFVFLMAITVILAYIGFRSK